MQSAPVNAAMWTDRSIKLLGQPGTVAVTGRRVEPVWINMSRQDGEIAAADP
jgi:hypothetical protein